MVMRLNRMRFLFTDMRLLVKGFIRYVGWHISHAARFDNLA